MTPTLCKTGVAALSERHVEERKRAKQFIGELTKLRHSKVGHQSGLADLQREARANATSFADIQVTECVSQMHLLLGNDV